MKILFFIPQIYHLGGAEKLASDLLLKMNRSGIQADLVTMYTKDLHNTSQREAFFYEEGVKNVYHLGLKVNPNKVDLFKAALKLRGILKNKNYDFIETSTVSPSIIGGIATLFSRVTQIFGIHQVYDTARESSFNYWVYKLILSFKIKKKVYYISKYVEKSAKKYFMFLRFFKTKVIYNSIENKFFEEECLLPNKRALRERFSLPETDIILLYCGRLASYKGIDTVLYSSAPYLRNKKTSLVFAGFIDTNVLGTEKMLTEMNAFIEKNQITSKVYFLDYIENVEYLMRACDILIHPTKIEGFGLGLVEALASKLLIISSNVEAIPEVLSDTNSTILKSFDSKNYTEAISHYINQDTAQSSIVKTLGYERALNFTLQKRFDSYLKFLNIKTF